MVAIAAGFLINNFFSDRVQQTIQAAENAGRNLEIEAGVQLRQTIENARIAYADSLNLTMDRVDQITRNTLDQLGVLVEGFQNRNNEILINLAARAQQIANTLPFHNDRPQLTSVTPRYIIRNDQTPVILKFTGNFEHASQVAFAPRLTFHGRSLAATHITTQQLEFSVLPQFVFPPNLQPNPRGFLFSEGSLEVPYRGGPAAVFRATLCALPPSPGPVILYYSVDRIVREERVKESQEQRIGSCPEDGGDDQIDKMIMASPSDGWHVKKGSSDHRTSAWGDCKLPTFFRDDGDMVIWKASTIAHNTLGHNMGNNSGRMHVILTFREWRDITVTDHFVENIQLRWGDTHAFNHPLTKWRVEYHGFDDSRHVFVGSDISVSPYLKIKNQGGGFVIQATKPRELDGV